MMPKLLNADEITQKWIDSFQLRLRELAADFDDMNVAELGKLTCAMNYHANLFENGEFTADVRKFITDSVSGKENVSD